MKKKSAAKSLVVNSYQALVKRMREELEGLDSLLRQRTAQSYWWVGKFVHEHLLQNKDRANYGDGFWGRFARDVHRDESTLLNFSLVKTYMLFGMENL